MTNEKTSEIEIVKEIYSALNNNDILSYLSFFDTMIDRFEDFGSRHQGIEGLRANFSQGRDNWAEGSCTPEKFTTSNNKVIVSVHVKVRLKNKTEWNEGTVIDIFTFENQKVTEFYSFLDKNKAMKWAGVNAF